MWIALRIAGLVAQEAARALAFPLHLVAYLPQRRRHEARCREVLAADQPAPDSGDGALHAWLQRRRPAHGATPHVFVSAGEASGETHAAAVMRAVHAGGLRPRWSCFGGSAMRDAGGTLLFPLSRHAIMGVSGVLRSLPFLIRALARYLRLLRDDPPDLVVLVDYPGLHLILGRLARERGIPVLHYIAPQYWAWAPWRMRRYRRCVDATLVIFPFEARFFAREGLPSEYVGHPLLDHLLAHPPDPEIVARALARPTLVMLPGSRRSEIESNVPAFAAIARRLRRDRPDLRIALLHVDAGRAARMRALLAEHGGEDVELHVGPLASWLRGARAVLAKSGTGSLEACLHGAPTVVVYRVKGWMAEWCYRTYLSVPWVASANLVAGSQVVPELVFRSPAGWERAERELRALLEDGPARARCLAGLEEVRARMGAPGASARAARWVIDWFAPTSVRAGEQPALDRRGGAAHLGD